MKASNNAERIGKVRRRIKRNPNRNTGKKRRTPEKSGVFKKYQEKEKSSEKAGEHQEREELFGGTGKTWRASGKSGEAKEKSGVSFTTPEKEKSFRKNW